jgi:hypothetical protein
MVVKRRKVLALKLEYCKTHPIAYKKGAAVQPAVAADTSSSVPAWKLKAMTVDEEIMAPMQINTKNSICDTLTTGSSLCKNNQLMKEILKIHVMVVAVYPNAKMPLDKRLSSNT